MSPYHQCHHRMFSAHSTINTFDISRADSGSRGLCHTAIRTWYSHGSGLFRLTKCKHTNIVLVLFSGNDIHYQHTHTCPYIHYKCVYVACRLQTEIFSCSFDILRNIFSLQKMSPMLVSNLFGGRVWWYYYGYLYFHVAWPRAVKDHRADLSHGFCFWNVPRHAFSAS